MKEKIASILRKWADRLAPIEIEQTLSVERYEIVPISCRITDMFQYSDLPYLYRDMACKIGEEMRKAEIINYQSRPTDNGKLEVTATAYVGKKKV